METNGKKDRAQILAQIRMLMFLAQEMRDTRNSRRAIEIEVMIDKLRSEHSIHDAELFPHNDRC